MKYRFIVLIGALSLACVLAAIAAVVLQPPTFSTRREAVTYVLQRHGLQVQEVFFDQQWPDSMNTLMYNANVSVDLHGGSRVSGYFECSSGEHKCSVSLPRIGLLNEPVPDITVHSSWPLLEWIEAHSASIRSIADWWK